MSHVAQCIFGDDPVPVFTKDQADARPVVAVAQVVVDVREIKVHFAGVFVEVEEVEHVGVFQRLPREVRLRLSQISESLHQHDIMPPENLAEGSGKGRPHFKYPFFTGKWSTSVT